MTAAGRGDWSDDRLAAAFAARSATAPRTPVDLADAIHGRLAHGDRGLLKRWPRPVPVAALAAVAVLVAVLGGSGLIGERPVASGSNAPTSAGPPNPIVAAMANPLTVAEALAIRDGGVDGQEIVVAGFLSPLPTMFCALDPGPFNPSRLRCSADRQWVMEQQEQLWGPSAGEPHEPTGPAFNPSFALVEAPEIPMPETDEALPPSVVLMGHFDDRRARLCPAASRDECAATFVADRVLAVDGRSQAVGNAFLPEEGTPRDSASAVDALATRAAPGSLVVSRRLLPVSEARRVEPLLANDELIPDVDPDNLAWIVTTVGPIDGVLLARTFMLLDGSSWFAEITATVVRELDRAAPESSQATGPVATPPSRDAFSGAPTAVLGIPVRNIQALEHDRQAAMDALGRDEIALRAWYVAPDPSVQCEDAPPAIHPPAPPCDEARHWLLDAPSQYGIMRGQVRDDPSVDHYPPVLNPLLPVDVPFDVGPTWQGETAVPRPVIVLGHFEDNRVDTYAANLYFVVDALAWTAGRTSESIDRVIRLTPNSTEDPPAVLARIQAVSPEDAVASWMTVADASDFVAIDRASEGMAEFTTGAPVWMVARLVHDETDGRQRLAVVWAFTADGGSRVWAEECPDCSPDLATTLDIRDLDASTPLVHVFDYDRVVSAAGPATGLSGLSWQQPHGNATDALDVARGRTDREVVIRWSSPSCPDVAINIKISDYYQDGGFGFSVFTRDGACEGSDRVVHRILLEFDHAIDIGKIEGPSCCG